MKPCNLCRQVKPLAAFHRDVRRKDGRQARCKECQDSLRTVSRTNLCHCGKLKLLAMAECKRCADAAACQVDRCKTRPLHGKRWCRAHAPSFEGQPSIEAYANKRGDLTWP